MTTELASPDRTAAYLEVQRAVAALAVLLTESSVEAATVQWAGLAALSDAESSATAIIDPEALLLVSLWLMPRAPTMHATVHDWVAKWSDLLSVQRTRNIAKSFSPQTQHELRAVAVTAHERGKDFRWLPVVKGTGEAASPGARAEGPDPRGVDTRLPYGASRLPVERDALLVLRFRMAFGVGARADALAYLLARGAEWSTVTEIAQATGYTPSAIRRALDRMAEASIVLTVDDGTTRFRCDHTPWGALLGLTTPVEPWRYWLQHFTFVASFVEWADTVARRKLTSYAILEGLRSVARAFRPTDDRDALRAWDHAFRDGSTFDEMEAAINAIASGLLHQV